ncbi:MAG: pyruvate dehydrogenase (acetyl-transferring), homodimeric type [Melioribacter sp.]|uniref:pyruvate dehydrogenase (acetyl-transferring), homodimeric type n=1 Tax=Rosettibacter primus TaxID=3111523 RepID=UPI00247D5357|nr:pyruvate dehydrogenase (acetyl-transferring), homodimeric type [Melioribacter sp.]
MNENNLRNTQIDDIELREWLESLEYVLQTGGPEKVKELLHNLDTYAHEKGVEIPFTANTPHINTIPKEKQPPFPGGREIERRIKSLVRWNAMAMVVRANKIEPGIGGHISTYASLATLYEIGFNHFFRGKDGNHEGDIIYFQGHAAPGVYARAFLEGRLTKEQLENFRRELQPGGGLSSYPHPWLMPDFWEFPTVSMGLGPIQAIYRARFIRYLEDRGLKKPSDQKVWAFIGDGETDEPETLGAITLAAREKLDNLIFVINCNLQRLDGPVRGNGNIIQELEAIFRGAGWNVIKVVWGSDWDPLLEADKTGLLIKRMNESIDGESQNYVTRDGKYIRQHFFGKYPELLKLVEHYTDEQLEKMKRGGHDPEKVYAAYKAAVEHKDAPTVILAKTVKGYGLGEAGEGKNITHQQKKLNEEELREFRTRFSIPISDEEVSNAPFYRPPEDSPEIRYLKERRKALGGYIPKRIIKAAPLKTPSEELFEEFYKGSDGHEVSTTMVYVRILSKLLKDKEIGHLIVPIVPDEARTFGMEALFRQVGIYSHVGQLYEPVDKDTLLYYKEAKNGQILEEGITEAGAMSSFIAAGTAYSVHGINTIPFFSFYSMFGFQRVGDLIWAAGDMRCRGFLLGATAGRTTLAGEGLQHQDGHSHLLAYPVPNLLAYDPAFAYELAVIIRDGIYRMYEKQEDIFYYITIMNENYVQPPMPGDVKDGILRGMYKFKVSEMKDQKLKAHLLGSGTILNEVIKAAEILENNYKVSTDIWSVTSYKNLHLNAQEIERWNMFHPDQPKLPYISEITKGESGVFVAASDYVQIIKDAMAKWLPGPLHSLGTYGFGRSDSRAALRDFFEVDAKHIVYATLYSLYKENKIKLDVVKKAQNELGINPDKPNPAKS